MIQKPTARAICLGVVFAIDCCAVSLRVNRVHLQCVRLELSNSIFPSCGTDSFAAARLHESFLITKLRSTAVLAHVALHVLSMMLHFHLQNDCFR
jgi:hypothetical protein